MDYTTKVNKETGADGDHINLLQIEKLDRDGEVEMTGTLQLKKGADVPSAVNLVPGSDGNYFDVTGTISITSIQKVLSQPGTIIGLHFDGVLTLIHHATNLILPGGANITTAIGDEAFFIEYDTEKWRCFCYTKASGAPLLHAASHQSGGSDSIKLDDLAAPDDNTDLDFSTAKHGLVPKGPNVGDFLKDDGTWATPAGGGKIAQIIVDTDDVAATKSTGFPNDDTIPQRDEGDEILSCAITPQNASSTIIIFASTTLLKSTSFEVSCLFISSSMDALLTYRHAAGGGAATAIYSESAGSTDARTYSVRVGDSTGNDCYTNKISVGGANKFGATEKSRLVVMEVLP